MKKIVLFTPQWQDSGPSKELYEGAVALRDYFRSICRMPVHEIPIDASEDLKVEYNIYGYSVLYDQLQCIGRELEISGADTVFSLGGGCGIEIPVVSYLVGRALPWNAPAFSDRKAGWQRYWRILRGFAA